MAESKWMRYCTHCSGFTDIRSKVHICSKYKEGVLIARVKRRWKHDIGAWVLAEDDPHVVKLSENKAEVEKASADAGYATCEVPKKEEKTEEHDPKCICDSCRPLNIRWHSKTCPCRSCNKFKESRGVEGYKSAAFTWVDVKPWDGVERAKWPNTFDFLLAEFYCGTWEKGLRISSQDYQNRILKGEYVREPRPGPGGQGYYWDQEYWNIWHGASRGSVDDYHGPYSTYDQGSD